MTQSLLSLVFPKAASSPLPQPIDAQVHLSQFADDFAMWAQASGIRSITLSCKNTCNKS